MFELIHFQPTDYGGASPTVREADEKYRRRQAQDFNDRSALLNPRQANFYENLIRLALAVGSNVVPVDFTTGNGRRMYLDRGCIKIAEHAGFVRPLENNSSGLVSTIRLTWRV